MVSHYSPNRIIIPWPTEQGPLPFDCLVCICEYLQPKDLVRFALACREFYHVARTGSLWRLHCLQRWVLCSLVQVTEGNDRWRRYYVHRRQQEDRLERGSPGGDYYSLCLQGHNTEITKMLYIKSFDTNSDGMIPINLVSYDRLGFIFVWEVAHKGIQCEYCWEGKTSKRRSAMAASSTLSALAYAGPAGDSVLFINTMTWREKERSELKLPPMTSTSGRTVLVTNLMYAEFIGKLPKPFLMVARGADTECSRIEIWDIENESADKPLVMLDTVGVVPTNLQLSTNNILAVCGDREYEESCSPDVKIWDMTLLPVDGSLVKENIVIRSKRDVMNIQWWSGRSGVLAIGCPGDGGLTIWELQPYLDQLRPSRSKGAKKNQLPVKPQQQPISLLYTSANYTVHNFYCSEPIFPMASTKFYLLFGGDRTGQLNMLPVSDDKFESLFITHTAPITGVAATDFGVFTCSRDYSIRVLKWRRTKTPDEPPILDSLYTLLGGSVLHTAYGFSAVDFSYNTVSGITGERILIYVFQR